jgi:menaquinol-cytochrome c reductase iron-sulfur subunit
MSDDPGTPPPVDESADTADEQATNPSRRTFLIRSIAAIGGGITAAVGIPAAVFVTGSARAATTGEDWIRLGSASSVEPGAAPVLMKAIVSRRTGYLVEEQEVSVFVTTTDGVEFSVLSNICTHLGCRVRWVEDESGFFCPCHNAVFGPDGGVLTGPPPRPLDKFEVMVEEGQLYFKEL